VVEFLEKILRIKVVEDKITFEMVYIYFSLDITRRLQVQTRSLREIFLLILTKNSNQMQAPIEKNSSI